MPYIPYTDEQKQLANSVDLPAFLKMRGEKLVPVGREFKLVYHDGYEHDVNRKHGGKEYDDFKDNVCGNCFYADEAYR